MHAVVCIAISCFAISSCPFMNKIFLTAAAAWASIACIHVPPAAGASINSLVGEALTRNPELNFYTVEIAAARGQRRAAGAWPYPGLNTDLGGKHVRDLDGNSLGTGPAWSLSVTQSFEYPGRLRLRKAIAERQIELAELGLDNFRITLANKVRSLAHRAIIAERKAEAAGEVSKRFRDLLSILEQRVQQAPAGVVPMVDMRVIEANAIVQERRVTEAARDAAGARYEINQLRGSPPETPLTIAQEDVGIGPIPATEELLRWAQTKNFDFRTRVLELEQHGFKVRLTENERWPAFTIGPYTTGERVNDQQIEAGISLSVPLPFWNNNVGNIETAKARREQARIALTVTWREIERKIVAAAAAYRSQRDKISQRRPHALQELREATQLADENYRTGALPLATYTELQKDLAWGAVFCSPGGRLAGPRASEFFWFSRLVRGGRYYYCQKYSRFLVAATRLCSSRGGRVARRRHLVGVSSAD